MVAVASHRPVLPPMPRSFDGFELLRHLGSGGMAHVYLARDTTLDRMVALKVAATSGNPRLRARFFMEARALARVHHPNVIEVFHSGEVIGEPYLVTEYVDGIGLDRVAAPLRWRRGLTIAVGLARALAATHSAGLIHRDVKPSNVMIDDNDQVKLIDFGLAIDGGFPLGRLTGRDLRIAAEIARGSPPVHLTEEGRVAGTPRYLAPEVAQGGVATWRSDVYSLGLVLQELLFGCDGEVVLHVPGPLTALIDRCVSRRPEDRPATVHAVRDELEGFAASAAPPTA